MGLTGTTRMICMLKIHRQDGRQMPAFRKGIVLLPSLEIPSGTHEKGRGTTADSKTT
jgi:hypothetical protein